MTSTVSFPVRPIEWIPDQPAHPLPGHIRILDQTVLPLETRDILTDDLETVYDAISMLRVRGAPAIGIAAAMGLVVAVQHDDRPTTRLRRRIAEAAGYLAGSRPTAVNLFYALDRMQVAADRQVDKSPTEFKQALIDEASAIRDEDAAMCRAIGRFGADLLKDARVFLTHCNAGSLATAEYGTALAPIYTLHGEGHAIRVFADETRPLLQGARLTAWELQRAGIDCTVICDGAAAQVLREGHVDAVLVGADRIAANGDTANKIGTYGLALAAKAHDIPFYVCAPTTTIDAQCPNGAAIPIETRDETEVSHGFGRQTLPDGVAAYNPAFDVTPAPLIRAIITERGPLRPETLEISECR